MRTYRRKRPRTLKAWFKRNTLYFILFGVLGIVFVCVIGAMSNQSFSTANEPVTPAPVITVAPTTTSIPTPTLEPIVIEKEAFYFDVPLSHELQDYIRELCEADDVPMELVIAMIDVESSFRANVVSKTNDYGLMQINTCNHETLSKDLGITDFLDSFQNVRCGIYIIAGHLRKTDGDIVLALMRYNNGATGAKRLWDKGIYSTSYTEKIMAAYESYKESRPTE